MTYGDNNPPLITHLYDLSRKEDRGALATLRRGLAEKPGMVMNMYSHVAPYVPHDAGWRREQAYYLTAALFGLDQRPWTLHDPENFGWSMLQLRHAAERPEPVDRRFATLLDAEWEDLPVHLRGAVSLMKDKVLIDWGRLLRDLTAWSHPDKWVQRRWARSYWSAHDEAGSDTSND